LPERWRSAGALDLARVRELEEQPGGPLAGILDPAAIPDDALPGLSAGRPLSSYRVRKVLECPHRFLFEDLLYFREPTGPPSLRDIDPMHYGGLLHLVVERYYATYGQSFCQRDGDLEHWVSLGDAMAEEVFTEFCQEYPLVGEAVREQQLERVRQDLREYLEYDWRSPGSRAYEGVEKSFGFPDPVELAIDRSPGGRSLFVRGYIDRIDLERGTTLIRDLKSGKPHPRIGRESDPHYRLDLQLGLYGLVTQELAEAWNVPRRIAAAYVYPRGRGELERGFRDDWDELETSTRDWLRLAMELIANRTFPRTPDPGDCTFCAFNKVCSPGDVEASRSLLADSDGALGELLALKEETR
jgi:RecB family exonuclease